MKQPHLRVGLRVKQQRRSQFATGLRQCLLGLRRLAQLALHVAAFENRDQLLALRLQFIDLAVDALGPFLKIRALFLAKVETVGKRVRILALELEDRRALVGELLAQAIHLDLEKVERLSRAGLTEVQIVFLDQLEIFVENPGGETRRARFKADLHQRGHVAPRRAANPRTCHHRTDDLVRRHLVLIFQNIKTVCDVQHVGTRQKPLLDKLKPLCAGHVDRARGKVRRNLRCFHKQARPRHIGGRQACGDDDRNRRNQGRDQQEGGKPAQEERKIKTYLVH